MYQRDVDEEEASSASACAKTAVLAVAAVVAHPLTAVTSTFGRCLGRLRRGQFDEEHQRALLSCHSTDEHVLDASPAMIELRRRVMQSDTAPVTRWKQRKLQEKAKRQQRDRKALADATAALDELLGASPIPVGDCGVRLEDVRRLSVDELLALTPATEEAPEQTGGDVEEDKADMTKDGARLREWLAAIDSPRAGEYRAYAKHMERHGFHSLADLAQLGEADVEQAMSEVGIAKFAHRLRIRKAIRELHGAQPEPASVAA